MNAYRTLLRGLERLELAAATLLFLIIVLSITAQVISRYGLSSPIVWVEEMATYSFIWIVFLGAAVGMKRLSHIKIEALSMMLPPRGRSALRLLGYAAMGFVLWHLCLEVPDVLRIESRSLTVSLPVNVPRMWFFSVPLFYSACSMSLTLIYYFMAELMALHAGKVLERLDGSMVGDIASEGI